MRVNIDYQLYRTQNCLKDKTLKTSVGDLIDEVSRGGRPSLGLGQHYSLSGEHIIREEGAEL